MPTAKDIRSAVRADLERDLRAREDAVVTVAKALDRLDEHTARLAEARTDAATEIAKACELVKLPDLARFLDRPVKELRALVKAADTTTAADSAADVSANHEPVSVGGQA